MRSMMGTSKGQRGSQSPQAMQALSEAAHTFGLKDKKIAVTKIGGRE